MTSTGQVLIKVIDVNDRSPVFEFSNYSTELYENDTMVCYHSMFVFTVLCLVLCLVPQHCCYNNAICVMLMLSILLDRCDSNVVG